MLRLNVVRRQCTNFNRIKQGETQLMNRSLVKVIAGIVVLGVVVVAGALVYIYASGGSAVPSSSLNAPALTVAENSSGSQVVYRIDPSNSEVSFTLDEKLMGNPNTVVGKTNQVAGDIMVDAKTPANSKVGIIKIDARGLSTDSEMRNRMIRGQILQSNSDKFEFIQFEPTGVTGLPDTVTPGQPITFKITGNLTIRDITQPVTFDATATLAADNLSGTASTVVKRADFKLEIPRVPTVADVTDEVKLAITFKATPAASSSVATAAATSAQ